MAIIGTRTFDDFSYLETVLSNHTITEIVSGGAIGADTLAEQYATKYNIPIKIFYPNWKKYGKIAGIKRNTQIVDYCDYVIAFWDGVSNGTRDTINKAKSQNKSVIIYKYLDSTGIF